MFYVHKARLNFFRFQTGLGRLSSRSKSTYFTKRHLSTEKKSFIFSLCAEDKVLVIRAPGKSSTYYAVPSLFSIKFPRQNQSTIRLAEGIPILDEGFATSLSTGPEAEALTVLLCCCSPLYSFSSPLSTEDYIGVDMLSIVGSQIELRFRNQICDRPLSIVQSRNLQFGLRAGEAVQQEKPDVMEPGVLNKF
jgi:hypothetical protein